MPSDVQSDLIVEACRVRKSYDTGAAEVNALNGVDLSVRRGEMVAIMGPSGCGKTTLLNCLSGLDEITARPGLPLAYPPAGDRACRDPDEMRLVAERPRVDGEPEQARPELGPIEPGHLVGVAVHEHAPATSGSAVEPVDFEHDRTAGGTFELGTRSRAEHDRFAVEDIVDGQDLRSASRKETQPSHHLVGEQGQTLLTRDHLDA